MMKDVRMGGVLTTFFNKSDNKNKIQNVRYS